MVVFKKIFLSFFLFLMLIFNTLIIKNREDFLNEKNNNNLNLINSEYSNDYSISMGGYHSSLLFSNYDGTNTLYMWGKNNHGQTGINNLFTRNLKNPTPIDINSNDQLGDEKILKVSLGGYHSSALIDNGDGTNTLYMWGHNDEGQIGNGSEKTAIHKPTPIDVDGDGIVGNEKIIDIEMGNNNSSAILLDENNNQQLYLWGNNQHNQVDDSNILIFRKPEKFDSSIFPEFKNYLDISFGNHFLSVVIENLNNETIIYSWGKNNYGQLGIGNNEDQDTPQPIDVNNNGELGDEKILKFDSSNSNSSALILNEDSSINFYIWGNNNEGQIGDGTYESKYIPTEIDINNDLIMGNEKILDFSLGSNFTFVLMEEEESKEKNSLYVWGNNSYGQLGNGTNDSTNIPILFDDSDFSQEIIDVEVGDYHSSILLNYENKSSFYSWGRNDFGQVGNGSFNQNVNNPTKISFSKFDFSLIDKNKNAFIFQANKEFDILDKEELKLIDNFGQVYETKHNPNFSKDRWITSGLESGKEYRFDYFYYDDEAYFEKGFWSVLTDYEIIEILNIKVLFNKVQIDLNINSSYFEKYNENERTVKFDYSINDGDIQTSESFLIDENQSVTIENLEFNSKYTIEKIHYNFNNELDKFKYDISILENNEFEIKNGEVKPQLFTNSFDLYEDSIRSKSFRFNLGIIDILQEMGEYDYIYLFGNSSKNGEEILIIKAYKRDFDKSGSDFYEFDVQDLEYSTTYEFIGVSLDESLETKEMFNEPVVVTTEWKFLFEVILILFSIFFIVFVIFIIIFVSYIINKIKKLEKNKLSKKAKK